MEQQGWIKLHRRLTEWEWYKNTNTFKLFIHLLINANHKPAKWQGMLIERGQFLSGIDSLSRQTGLSKQSVRTSLKHLKSTGELTSKSTNKNTLYTIVNYEQYQGNDFELTSKPTSQLTDEQQATNKQLTTNNNDKKGKNKKNEAINFILPDWIPKQDWQDWLEVRKQKGTVNTERALSLAVGLLEKEKILGHDPSIILQKSIMSGWVGLFPITPQKATQPAKPINNRPDVRSISYE